MHRKHLRARREFAIFSTPHYQKIVRLLDSPTKAGGLTFRLHHPTGNILPLHLRAVPKGHAIKGKSKNTPLTVLVSAAHDAQRDGSNESRLATGMSTGIETQLDLVIDPKNSFQTAHKLNFLHNQDLEEVDEAHHEFESTL